MRNSRTYLTCMFIVMSLVLLGSGVWVRFDPLVMGIGFAAAILCFLASWMGNRCGINLDLLAFLIVLWTQIFLINHLWRMSNSDPWFAGIQYTASAFCLLHLLLLL